MAIIEELRAALDSSDQSYREISRAIGVDHALLLRFSEGTKSLSLATAEKLAIYLGLQLK